MVSNIPKPAIPAGDIHAVLSGKKHADTMLQPEAKSMESQPGAGERSERVSQKQILMAALSCSELWQDKAGAAYATVPMQKPTPHKENHPVRSKSFRNWITQMFFLAERKAPSAQALEEVLRVAEARAICEGMVHPIAIRVARFDDRVFYDPCHSDWRLIQCSKDGWGFVEHAPVRFIRTRGMLAAPHPVRNGTLKELFEILHFPDPRSQVLLLSWLIGALNPDGPFPILKLEGEQGSGKSFATRIIRSLIDPNEAPAVRAPRSEEDLLIDAASSWVLAFDNQSGFSDELSDWLCRLATGGGLKKRELYSDSSLVIIEAKRPCLLNGIDEDSGREDLRDRLIHVRLEKLSNETRKTERDLLNQFENVHPKLLGCLLDSVCAALKNFDQVAIANKPRMLDFATWVVAAEETLGVEPGTFLEAYKDNRQQSYRDHVEASPVAQGIIQALNGLGDQWAAPAGEWLAKIKHFRPDGYNAWPKTATGMSNILVRLAPALRALGYQIEFSRSNGKRSIAIRKVPELSGTVGTECPEGLP